MNPSETSLLLQNEREDLEEVLMHVYGISFSRNSIRLVQRGRHGVDAVTEGHDADAGTQRLDHKSVSDTLQSETSTHLLLNAALIQPASPDIPFQFVAEIHPAA
jgi:hypothetical protein